MDVNIYKSLERQEDDRRNYIYRLRYTAGGVFFSFSAGCCVSLREVGQKLTTASLEKFSL